MEFSRTLRHFADISASPSTGSERRLSSLRNRATRWRRSRRRRSHPWLRTCFSGLLHQGPVGSDPACNCNYWQRWQRPTRWLLIVTNNLTYFLGVSMRTLMRVTNSPWSTLPSLNFSSSKSHFSLSVFVFELLTNFLPHLSAPFVFVFWSISHQTFSVFVFWRISISTCQHLQLGKLSSGGNRAPCAHPSRSCSRPDLNLNVQIQIIYKYKYK